MLWGSSFHDQERQIYRNLTFDTEHADYTKQKEEQKKIKMSVINLMYCLLQTQQNKVKTIKVLYMKNNKHKTEI